MLMRWNDPFKETKTLQNQINKLFGEINPLGVRMQGEEMPAAMWAPPVDVTETKDVLAFKFEVPGFKQEELTLNVENGALTLEGERKFEEEQKDKNYHRVERSLRAVLPLVRAAGEHRRVEGRGDSRRRRSQRRAPQAGRGEAEGDPHRDRLAQVPRARPQSGLRVPQSALRRQAGAMKTGRCVHAPPVAFPGYRPFYAPPVSGPALPHFDAVPLFRCLNADERELLGPVCRAVAYEKGEEVFREGDEATDLCFVAIGRVKVVKAGPDRDVILGLFGAGEPIGAVALFEGKRFPASAVALEPSTILRVPERDFFATIDAHPEMTRRLLQGLMLRQFEISRRLADLTGPVEKRIARLFLMLARRVGRRRGRGRDDPARALPPGDRGHDRDDGRDRYSRHEPLGKGECRDHPAGCVHDSGPSGARDADRGLISALRAA